VEPLPRIRAVLATGPVVHGWPFSRKSLGTTAAAGPLLPTNPKLTFPFGAMTPFQLPAVLEAESA